MIQAAKPATECIKTRMGARGRGPRPGGRGPGAGGSRTRPGHESPSQGSDPALRLRLTVLQTESGGFTVNLLVTVASSPLSLISRGPLAYNAEEPPMRTGP